VEQAVDDPIDPPSRPGASGPTGSMLAASSADTTPARTLPTTSCWLSPGSTSHAARTASASGHHTLASP
jgi:hypothetical protein